MEFGSESLRIYRIQSVYVGAVGCVFLRDDVTELKLIHFS